MYEFRRNPQSHSRRFLLFITYQALRDGPTWRPEWPKFGWLDTGSRWRRPIDHGCSSESPTYPGMTLLYPSKLSPRMSNGTNLKCLDFSWIVGIVWKSTYSTRYLVDAVNCVDNLYLVAFHIPVYKKDNKGRSRTQDPFVGLSTKTTVSISPPPTMHVDQNWTMYTKLDNKIIESRIRGWGNKHRIIDHSPFPPFPTHILCPITSNSLPDSPSNALSFIPPHTAVNQITSNKYK